ncbi:NADH-quinone oxidoreductase subunit C [Sphingomonas sp. 37zxx]|uniref:NADH-quinone oxidoreductase subunit C n=1 Tax=Sphingomonas sp. 37zxx TaxID=1550073 RepID=UPI00053BFB2B|nr:NADH-quinone oxidoreductase subunit C [Sphingomonas sp. 37zxx]
MKAPAPRYAETGDTLDLVQTALGGMVVDAQDKVGEVTITVDRLSLYDAMIALRDTPGLEYQQLMEIAGVDYPSRPERFDVCYHLLSLTRNHRLRVRVTTDEEKPVPSIVAIWPVAGWLEREVYDMYGVLFDGNPDLRRILTDYGFRGHPFRKDFPLSGFVELRYSEEAKRVVYEPVKLAQDFRSFDFMSPWEGAQYVLPGDEKAAAAPQAQAKGAPSPVTAAEATKAPAGSTKDVEPQAAEKKVTESRADTGAGRSDSGNLAKDKPVDPDVPSPDGGEGKQ